MANKKVSLADWLYRAGYGYVYEAWLISPEHSKNTSLDNWVKDKYLDIWKKYNASQ